MSTQKRKWQLVSNLQAMGFTFEEAQALRRIEMTLHRWSEEECNGTIQRDGDDGEGKPRRYYENRNGEHVRGGIVADRERGALVRLARIMSSHTDYLAYNQTDPRGCGLYLVARKDIRAGENLDAVYNRGLAVCD